MKYPRHWGQTQANCYHLAHPIGMLLDRIAPGHTNSLPLRANVSGFLTERPPRIALPGFLRIITSVIMAIMFGGQIGRAHV